MIADSRDGRGEGDDEEAVDGPAQSFQGDEDDGDGELGGEQAREQPTDLESIVEDQ